MDSKSRWYYENHGKAEGPISTLEIVKKIQLGELQLIDLVFKEGDGQWMPAEHFIEITGSVKTAGTEFKIDADWVVLRTIEVDGRNQYDQIGPFTIEQVLQLIDKGKVKFTDFVWRDGYENWVPLGHLDKYENPLESSVRVDMSIYEKPRIEDLSSAPKPPKFFKPANKIKPVPSEVKPIEAKGEDLASDKWQIEPPSKSKPAPVLAAKESPSPRPTERAEEAKGAQPASVKSMQSPAPSGPQENAPIDPRRRRKDDADTLEKNESDSSSPKKKEQLAVAKQRWSAVASAVAVFIFLCGGTLTLFFGHKAYRTHQARSSKMTFEPVATVTQRKRKASPEAVKIEKVAPMVQVKTPPEKESPKKISEFAEMTTKQKAYFFNSERNFLFYNSQKGVSLVSEVEKILKAPKRKKKNSQKAQIDVWLTKVQGLLQSVESDRKNERIYPELYQRLSAATQQLHERSQDLRSQMLNGRGPSKEWTLIEVSVEFKKLLKLAQDLD